MPQSQRDKWIDLWDPSQYISNATIPMLFINGTEDKFYRLKSWALTTNLVEKRMLRMTVGMKHYHQHGWAPKEIGIFVDTWYHNGIPLPELGTVQIDEGMTIVPLASQTRLTEASLHYTSPEEIFIRQIQLCS